MEKKVLIPSDISQPGKDYLAEKGYTIKMGRGTDEQTILEDVADCDALLARNEHITRAIMEAAIPCGIITRGGGGDNPRNIQASPLTGVQPGEAFDVMPWAEAATEYLLSICRDIHMPRKLKVAFCNGVDDCVHTAFRDMGFVAQPDGTFKLYIAGGLGGGWRMGILAAGLGQKRSKQICTLFGQGTRLCGAILVLYFFLVILSTLLLLLGGNGG